MKRYINNSFFIYRGENCRKTRRFQLNRMVFFQIIACLLFLFLLPARSVQAAPRAQEISDPIVIVIDPGHGGENEGTTENGFQEKAMTMITAQAMYNELLQFDNVQVYMTRTEDKDMTLKERAEFAAKVDADFLFSIHYNASGNHTLFGSEVWVSLQPPYNAFGYQFGYCQMLEMKDMGLYLRGIKTRLNDKGTADYYGIIRESVNLSIPAVIIEHCHVDEERDVPFCETEEDWIAFGKADARAVAKYFGLSSNTLNIDYSQTANALPDVEADLQVQSTLRDQTEPDVCMIELVSADYNAGYITVQVTAADYDSPMLYYDYSLDGGKSYCSLRMWPEVDVLTGDYKDTFNVKLQIPSGTKPEILIRAYNLADLYRESNPISFTQSFSIRQHTDVEMLSDIEDEANTPASIENAEIQQVNTGAIQNEKEPDKWLIILEIALLVIIFLFIVMMLIQMIVYHNRRKRRHLKKDAVDNRDHNR